MGGVPEGFVLPDWDAPVDLDARVALVPAGKVARGFIVAGMARRLRQRGVVVAELDSVVGFKSYPYTEQLRLLFKGGAALNPASPRRGLREVGRMAFPSILETLPGRVVFGVLGKDLGAIFRAAGKAYEIAGTGSLRVVDVGERHAHVDLADVYAFPDVYHAGVMEGVVLACERQPEVHVKVHGPTHVELFCAW